MIRTALAAMIFIVPLSAAAAEDRPTVQDMLPACTRAADPSVASSDLGADASFCRGFVMGTLGILDGNCQSAKQGGQVPFGWLGATPPSPISGEALVRAFVNWANAHPEAWGDVYTVTVARALTETFPCEAG